ncbi:UNVERIFIED_CONTAM: Transcription factor DIVARICATA [Sesamum calycinum]|uniref:Transcription factor DIVARICATA n=1 Tax=Sesamum calycinum TaxID=2727403 RepID=A0AAW2RPR8_9LAMI
METICPTSLVPDSSWFIGQGKSTKWTKEENKKFESALAFFDEKTPNRWFKVAAMIPGKSVFDVINQYRELVADVSDIEAGLVPVPGYLASPFTLELSGYRGFDVCRKKGRTCDQERKKGVPWTEDEHRRFLLGLQKYGKGDWRSISRHFVVSKTPTQVASHAQKYYLRQLSGGKDKKRPSIHDITTVDLIDTTSPSDNNRPHLLEKINELTFQQKLDEALTVFDSSCGDSYAAYPFNVSTQSRPSSCLHIQVPRFRG